MESKNLGPLRNNAFLFRITEVFLIDKEIG